MESPGFTGCVITSLLPAIASDPGAPFGQSGNASPFFTAKAQGTNRSIVSIEFVNIVFLWIELLGAEKRLRKFYELSKKLFALSIEHSFLLQSSSGEHG